MYATWQALDGLTGQHGESFYALDLGAFRRNYSEFTAAFARWYPSTTIGYSYKTNYVPRLGEIVQGRGGYAEVVSGMEYQLARRIGVPGDRIIFNGPYKPRPDLERALLEGAICNLDSVAEVDVVESVAAENPQAEVVVGLRCNLDLGTGSVSRFGLDTDDPSFAEVVARLRRVPNCVLAGLHVHSAAGGRSLDSYALRTKRLLELAAAHFPDGPRFLNVGGGYFGRMDEELRVQFPGSIPSYADYAEAVAAQVRAFYGETGPELIVEPGTALTADVMSYVAQVVGRKSVRGREVALVAGSVHTVKPTGHTKALPLTLVRRDPDTAVAGEVDLVGYTCMEHDVLAEAVPGPVEIGDFAVFRNVGAYTVVMKPPFIRPAPAVLAVEADGSAEVLRSPETMADVFATYHFAAEEQTA